MSANRLRALLIGALVLAGVLNLAGSKTDSRFVSLLSFLVFLCALVLYVRWRRVALKERRARVFDREAKTTDETRTRPDQ
ncbi:MAG: hypothetical protein ACJ76I_15575 [Gaiellaceae bacterium]